MIQTSKEINESEYLNRKLFSGNFEKNTHLKALNFSRNKLEDLPVELFAVSNELSVIDLSSNRFQILSDKVSKH